MDPLGKALGYYSSRCVSVVCAIGMLKQRVLFTFLRGVE